MDDDKILEYSKSIEEKLGSEDFAKISDDIGLIMTGNSENMKTIAEREKEIEDLKDRNSKLVSANGNLLRQIPVASDNTERRTKVEEKPAKINLKDAFDAKGNFIH